MYLAAEQQEVEGKVDGEDQHEERDDDLNGGAFIFGSGFYKVHKLGMIGLKLFPGWFQL